MTWPFQQCIHEHTRPNMKQVCHILTFQQCIHVNKAIQATSQVCTPLMSLLPMTVIMPMYIDARKLFGGCE